MNLSNKDIYLQYALSQFLPFGEVRRGSSFNAFNCMKAYSFNGERYGYYGYDASGERTYKYGLDRVETTTNQGGIDITEINWEVNQLMLYPNGYININQNGEYTKHYYADALRIASKIGSGKSGLDLCSEASIIENIYPSYLSYRIDLQREEMKEELTELVPNSEDIVDIVPNNYPDFCDIGGGGQETALFFYHPDHLGSTGMVTDNSSNITQGFLYAPFGEIITEFNPSWESGRIPKYSFNAKELDEENGMYYYSARYYAPPTFISRDPMFEKYPSISPYTYCSNNPVKRIDPNGEDDYEVDRKTGELILLKKTDEKTDRLVGQNWLGKVKQNKDGSYKKSIEIDKSVLQNREVDGLNQKMDFGSGENAKNKAIDVFNFLSDNTDVEWSALGYGTGDNNQNSITTGGSADIEPRVTDLINKIKNIDINYFYHNHPGNDGADYPSTGQSGERGNDLAVWKHIWKNNPNAVMGIRAGKSTQQYKYNPQNSKGYSPIIRH